MPTPDYQRIAELERELGIGDHQPEPERGIQPSRTVCLIKNCGGSDTELRTWSGILLRRVHEH